jgi:hypothetical protein
MRSLSFKPVLGGYQYHGDTHLSFQAYSQPKTEGYHELSS